MIIITRFADLRHVDKHHIDIYASRVRDTGSWIQSPCLVPVQDASGPRDGCICTRWLQSISSTQI